MYKLFILFSLILLSIKSQEKDKDKDQQQDQKELNIRKECLQINRSVCLGQTKQEIGLQANEQDLVGHWKFDEQYSIDSTLNQNDMFPTPTPGPQQGGSGNSAYFNGIQMSEIKHIQEYNAAEFSISFWIFLVQQEKGEGWKTLVQKGDTAQELTPTIQLWPNENRLHVKVSTDFDWNENLDSNSGLLVRRWTHLTFTFSNMLVQIYINGILDNQLILKGQLKHNSGSFHVGKDPWHKGTIFYLDDLRIYNKILKKHEIISISSSSQILTGESFAVLGCDSCSYQRALVSCPDKYHLCTFPEIYAGAYQIARTMGWFRSTPYFWIKMVDEEYSEEKVYMQELFDPNIYKLGICCMDKGF